jgi:alanine dehydrogenase
MSEVAGRLSIAVGAHALLRAQGGRGTLLGGVAGTPAARVVVIGGGVAGEHALAEPEGRERVAAGGGRLGGFGPRAYPHGLNPLSRAS